MTEIRSTMEMVLERAERLCSENDSSPVASSLQDGMRAGASLMQDSTFNIVNTLANLDPQQSQQFIEGILTTFMRNITLPREEGTPWQPAMEAITTLSDLLKKETPQLQTLLNEVSNILSRYHEHRQQVRSQLEEAFTAQAAQLQQNMEQQTGKQMNISPAQHPKFNEELQKHFDQLSEQYTNALEQYKQAVSQFFVEQVK